MSSRRHVRQAITSLWENRDRGGCCHYPLWEDEDGKQYCAVIGWLEFGKNSDEPEFYCDKGWRICAGVLWQGPQNYMTTDMGLDFSIPEKDGELFDGAWFCVEKDASWEDIADDLNSYYAKPVYEWLNKNENEQ